MSVSARDVTVQYGHRVAVDGVTLEAKPGEVLAILGANGSGKTSLLRALAGVQPCRGIVARGAETVGYMPQDNASRSGLAAFEVVLLGRMRSLALRVGAPDLAAAEAALAELGIAALASRPIDQLSGGQRQLVYLAQVLAADPAILLLDEPTSALDIAHQLHVLDLIRAATIRRGLTTVAVLHDLNAAARFSDRLALMSGGRLVLAGPAAEVLTAAHLQQAYGVEVSVMTGLDGHPVVIPLQASPAARTSSPQKETIMSNTIRLTAIALCAIFAAGPAFAHAHLRSAVPAVDSTVSTAPSDVAITFSEGVEPKFSTIEVDDSTGKRVDKQDPHTAPNDNKVLSVSLPTLPAGTYKVIWHATAVDTHKTEGTFMFTVK